ncbi:unnamed protein product [Musa textilis]
MVKHNGFRRYSKALRPLSIVVSQNTIRMEFIEHSHSKIIITIDMWTYTNQKKGYTVVTTNFIDDSWTLRINNGLEVTSEGIERIRDSVAYWAGTPKRVESFEETARQLSILRIKVGT